MLSRAKERGGVLRGKIIVKREIIAGQKVTTPPRVCANWLKETVVLDLSESTHDLVPLIGSADDDMFDGFLALGGEDHQVELGTIPCGIPGE